MNKELPEDIRVAIYKEAEAKYAKLPATFKGGAIQAYRDGAEEHHALYLESERRLKIATDALERIEKICSDSGLKQVDISNLIHMSIYTSMHTAKQALAQLKEGGKNG